MADERKKAIDKITSEFAKRGTQIGRTGYQRMIDMGIEALKKIGFSSSEIQHGLAADSGIESRSQVGGTKRKGKRRRRRILTMSKKKKKVVKKKDAGKSVKVLKAELEKCKDPSTARKLRKQLRDAGHTGGLGKPSGDNLAKAREAKGKSKKTKKMKKMKKNKESK